MYLIGNNSNTYPWFIPKDFPYHALKKNDREMLLDFIDENNEMLKWTTCECYIFTFMIMFYYPLAMVVHSYIRKSKFRNL